MSSKTKIKCFVVLWYNISLPHSASITNTQTKAYRVDRFSPPVGEAVNDDGQDQEEHGYPKDDADQLLQLRQSASGVAEDEAARPLVRRRAAVEPDRGICECIPEVNTNQHAHVDMRHEFFTDHNWNIIRMQTG